MKTNVHQVGRLLLVVALALVVTAGAALADSHITPVAEGLNGPQGVLVGPDGTIYVAENGFGGEETIENTNPAIGDASTTLGDTARVLAIAPDGTQTVLATLPSIAAGDEIAGAARLALVDGSLFVTNGEWIQFAGMERRPLMAVIAKVADGAATEVVDAWAFEVANNPDPHLVHAHPYDMAQGPDGKLWFTDAAGNDLLKADLASGVIEVVTVFPGQPSPLPSPFRGDAMESDPVPTGLAFDDQGNAYVSLLPGFPFLPGASKVVKVAVDGSQSDYATGLTMVTDLVSGPDGHIYGVSIGTFTEQGPVPNSGAVLRLKEGSAAEVVAGELSFPTALDFDDSGNAFVTLNGIGAPGSGAVVRIDGLTSAAGSPLPAPQAPSAGQPEALPETGGSSISLGLIAAALGALLVAGGLLLKDRRQKVTVE